MPSHPIPLNATCQVRLRTQLAEREEHLVLLVRELFQLATAERVPGVVAHDARSRVFRRSALVCHRTESRPLGDTRHALLTFSLLGDTRRALLTSTALGDTWHALSALMPRVHRCMSYWGRRPFERSMMARSPTLPRSMQPRWPVCRGTAASRERR